eukprot:gene7918-9298_t
MPAGLTIPQKVKFMFKNYGIVAVVVHFSLYLATLGSFYVALSHGIDVQSIFTYFGVERSALGEGLGVFAVAFALTKLTGLVRVPFTIISVPIIAKYIKRLRAGRK